MQQSITISFDDVSAAQANRYAQELANDLRSAHDSVVVEVVKADPNTMDLGMLVSTVLNSDAMGAALGTLNAWLQKRDAAITIEKTKGTYKVRASGLRSSDAVKIAEIIQGK